MQGNSVVLVGNLTDEPELRFTPQGVAVANFRIAVNRRFKDQSGEWRDGETSYFRVNCWRQLAENIAESLSRGTRVVVSGTLKMRQWETQEGEKRTVVEIEADDVGPSLRWATAKVEKSSRGGGGGGGGVPAAVPAGGGDDWGSPAAPADDEVPF